MNGWLASIIIWFLWDGRMYILHGLVFWWIQDVYPVVWRLIFNVGGWWEFVFLPLVRDLTGNSAKAVLARLVSDMEDEIWHAALHKEDGELERILESLANEPQAPGRESLSLHDRSKFRRAVEATMPYSDAAYIQARIEDIRDRLANMCREPRRKERWKFDYLAFSSGMFSILCIAVIREHKQDVGYLLETCNANLQTQNTWEMKTALHAAVAKRKWDLVSHIFDKSSSTSPSIHVNIGDYQSTTPLHQLVLIFVEASSAVEPDGLTEILGTFVLFYRHDANVDALDCRCMTPLHLLLSTALEKSKEAPNYEDIIRLVEGFLEANAETPQFVFYYRTLTSFIGNSLLHIACRLQQTTIIENLVTHGADLEALDGNAKTPKKVYLEGSNHDINFALSVLTPSPTRVTSRKNPKELPQTTVIPSDRRKAVCDRTQIYCRYQLNGLHPDGEDKTFLYWASTDLSVSDVLYPPVQRQGVTFLEACRIEANKTWEPYRYRQRTRREEEAWRWVNFPANNITWIKDFFKDCMSSDSWKFFQSNIRARETNENSYRVRMPHAKARAKDLQPSREAPNDGTGNVKPKILLSLVIPFIDVETEDHWMSTSKRHKEVMVQLEEAYFPFTGLDGIQTSQTLDQTAGTAEKLSKLRSKDNQVVYRWSKRQLLARRNRAWGRRNSERRSRSSLQRSFWRGKSMTRKKQDEEQNVGVSGPVHDLSSSGIEGVVAGGIRQEDCPKWLMVRQLWLWKLDDGEFYPPRFPALFYFYVNSNMRQPGTVLTAIPSRRNLGIAENLLETILQSRLHEVSSTDDLVTHIVLETVTFLDKFKWAGLGEHILDIFEGEIAIEADKEASFFNNFTNRDWRSQYAGTAIHEAAKCTWLVKDIRDELRLIRKVFEKQLQVVEEFAKVHLTAEEEVLKDCLDVRHTRESFVKDCGLENLIQRIKHMDEDAAMTLEGLGNITQAMQAQASLKEAESARLMNLIILPFTVVTVIFTPLSFMTSLFAVNSDGFPQNDDGELRIPSAWLWRRLGKRSAHAKQPMEGGYTTTSEFGAQTGQAVRLRIMKLAKRR
ncbi:hypothetical protein F66182_3349 [Fusarium sp. NRRL 66182]|nr:hypothetical protein F66182_3349 [Fusarium sp. NRRL 66182]